MVSGTLEVASSHASLTWTYEQMNSYLRARFDVLVVGGGPAGIAAAACAGESGARVGIVDENAALGGQIWRAPIGGGPHSNDASKWIARLKLAGATTLFGRVFHQPQPGTLLAEGLDDVLELSYAKLILATGAREQFLPFPGWTLPNVMGAGGLQALVKSGLPIRGRKMVIAGTGPLLLAVAAYLRERGAETLLICEQAPWIKLARFGAALWRFPDKIGEVLQLRRNISRIRISANSWVTAAHGAKKLEAVTVVRSGKSETLHCDFLACGFHLVPNSELAILLGCGTRDEYVEVNDLQQTTVDSIFCAGEPTAIGGVDLALIEGQIAGLAAGGRPSEARVLFGKREKLHRFARMLNETFRLRSELKMLASADTLVCRCEDVPYAKLLKHASWRAAKLHTRCGMGPCQGRICGPAAKFLFHWTPDSVRPPIFPARVESLSRPPAQQPVTAFTGEHQ